MIQILEPDEKPGVFWHSSISQHRSELSVMQRGEWVPITYDVLDYIDCGKVYSHRSTLTDKEPRSYDYEVENQCYTNGYCVNDDVQPAISLSDVYTKRVGLNYAAAKQTLKGE